MNPHGYEPRWTIEQHRDELLDRLGKAIKRINELEAEVQELKHALGPTCPKCGWYICGHQRPEGEKPPKMLYVAFDCLGNPYAVSTRPEHIACDPARIKPYVPVEAEGEEASDNYVAWLQFRKGSIRVCDSDAEGAFRVYRHPKEATLEKP